MAILIDIAKIAATSHGGTPQVHATPDVTEETPVAINQQRLIPFVSPFDTSAASSVLFPASAISPNARIFPTATASLNAAPKSRGMSHGVVSHNKIPRPAPASVSIFHSSYHFPVFITFGFTD